MTSSCPNFAAGNLGKALWGSWGWTLTPFPHPPAQPRVGARLERWLRGAEPTHCTPSAGGAPSHTQSQVSLRNSWIKNC